MTDYIFSIGYEPEDDLLVNFELDEDDRGSYAFPVVDCHPEFVEMLGPDSIAFLIVPLRNDKRIIFKFHITDTFAVEGWLEDLVRMMPG